MEHTQTNTTLINPSHWLSNHYVKQIASPFLRIMTFIQPFKKQELTYGCYSAVFLGFQRWLLPMTDLEIPWAANTFVLIKDVSLKGFDMNSRRYNRRKKANKYHSPERIEFFPP